MRGDVFDPLAVDKDTPSILERAKIFGTCAHRQFSPARGFIPAIHDFTLRAVSKTWMPATSAGMTIWRNRQKRGRT
jgi:hypothetical protein